MHRDPPKGVNFQCSNPRSVFLWLKKKHKFRIWLEDSGNPFVAKRQLSRQNMAVSSIPSLVKRRKNRRLLCQWTSGERHGVNLKKATGWGWLLFRKKLILTEMMWTSTSVILPILPCFAFMCFEFPVVDLLWRISLQDSTKKDVSVSSISYANRKNSFPTIFTDSLLFGQSHWTPRHFHILGGAMLISIVSKNGKMKYFKPPMHKSIWVFSLCCVKIHIVMFAVLKEFWLHPLCA